MIVIYQLIPWLFQSSLPTPALLHFECVCFDQDKEERKRRGKKQRSKERSRSKERKRQRSRERKRSKERRASRGKKEEKEEEEEEEEEYWTEEEEEEDEGSEWKGPGWSRWDGEMSRMMEDRYERGERERERRHRERGGAGRGRAELGCLQGKSPECRTGKRWLLG